MKYWFLCIGVLVSSILPAADEIDFNRDIKSILSDKCYTCHGPDSEQRQGGGVDGLRFDTKEGAFADLDGNRAIVPGNVDASELVRRIQSDDPDEVMPPPDHLKSLSDAEKQTLVRWIEQGAPWETHWAYVPAKASPRDGAWIDQLVQERLANVGIKPSREADPRVLVRRLYFDLIGLPPTKQQVEDFLNAKSDQAWEDLVDELLASSHFGERMAIYWLDLVRYADTVGYHGDQDVSVSPYRDYVIQAFNQNMPFDQFTREQLAGDLLPEPTQDQLIASGYNKLGMMSAEGGAQPKEYLTKYASDRVRTASTVWLGSTLGCAECHDHKFDPFTQKDFYQFASFFADIKERGLYSGANRDGQWGPTVSVPDPDLPEMLLPVDQQLKALRDEYESVDLTQATQRWRDDLRQRIAGWQVIQPLELTSAFGATLAVQEGGSVLLSGPVADLDVYSLTAKLEGKGIRGLRIEVLPHDSLPGRGPGRAGNGNFVLSEIRASLVDANGVGKPLKFKSAVASFEQADNNKANPYKGWKASALIDGDTKGSTWGWAVMPQFGKANEVVLEFEKPLEVDSPTLRIRLDQNHENPGHTLGHFRISATVGPVELDPRRDLPEPIKALVAVDELTPEQVAELEAYYRSIAPLTAELRKKIANVEKQRAELIKQNTRTTLITQAVEPRPMRVLPRGNWMDESGPVVQPGVPHFLPPLELESDRRATRLDLANWLTNQRNPLTSRVFVNRLWKLLFGTGLSKVLDDMGSQGEFPSHPELLDQLSNEFVESGWNIKHMVKLIVMSEAYRQSSLMRNELTEIDPFNRLLARQSRYRLDAELVRDNALAVSGLLVRELGGRSVKPYQPAGLLRHLNFPRRTYKQDSGDDQYRRGVYTHWQRQFLHPAMKSFDAPAREECTAERPRSNTPLAALVLLNDPSYVEAARTFAERIMGEGAVTTDQQRIEMAFSEALNRSPSTAESEVLLNLLESQRSEYKSNPEAAKQLITTGLRPVPEKLDPSELAAFTAVTRTIFNMHEFITRN